MTSDSEVLLLVTVALTGRRIPLPPWSKCFMNITFWVRKSTITLLRIVLELKIGWSTSTKLTLMRRSQKIASILYLTSLRESQRGNSTPITSMGNATTSMIMTLMTPWQNKEGWVKPPISREASQSWTMHRGHFLEWLINSHNLRVDTSFAPHHPVCRGNLLRNS